MAQALIKFLTQQCWAVHEPVLRRGAEVMERHLRGERVSEETVAAIVAERDGKQAEKREETGRPPWSKAGPDGYYLDGQVAVVPVEGVIARHASMVNRASQPEGTTTEAIIGSLRRAKEDPRAAAILLDVDSPGGSVAGLDDVVEEVRATARAKPVWSLAHDLMASAAYWIGSQAQRLWVGPTAAAGSIGVYTLVEDSSKFWDQRGIRFHLVRAGQYKGVGVDGVPVSPEDLEVIQREVGAYYAAFVRDVASGRGLERERAERLADGRIWVGQEAVTLGLADRVGTYAQAVAALHEHIGPRRGAPTRGRQGSAPEDQTMTLAELKAAHPDLMAAHEKEVAERLNAANAERVRALEQQLAEAKTEKPATLAELKAVIPESVGGRAELLVEAQEKNLSVNGALQLVNARLSGHLAAATKRVAELEALNGAGKGSQPAGAGPGRDAGVPDASSLPPGASMDERKAFAKKEWEANAGGCRSRFISEDVYVAARARELGR